MSAGDLVSDNDGAAADECDRLEAEADRALAEAEYEFYALREALQVALAVPLRDRAIATTRLMTADESEPEVAAGIVHASTGRLASAAA